MECIRYELLEISALNLLEKISAFRYINISLFNIN